MTLALAGAAIGWAIAQVALAQAGAWLPAAAPQAATAWTLRGNEAWIAAGAALAGALAAAWPAWQAYRLDVAATLADA